MPSKTFDVEVHGLDVLRRKLDTRRILGPVKEEMIATAAKAGKKTADEKSKGQYGKKGFGRRIHISFEQGGLIAKVAVDSQVSGIALTIEEGRRPGRRPPYRPIKAWAQAGGIATPVRELQENIKLQGTRGIHFMVQASKDADDTLRGRVAPTERRIEGEW